MAIGRGCIFDAAFSKIANKQRFLVPTTATLRAPNYSGQGPDSQNSDARTARASFCPDSITETAVANVFHNSDCRHASSRPGIPGYTRRLHSDPRDLILSSASHRQRPQRGHNPCRPQLNFSFFKTCWLDTLAVNTIKTHKMCKTPHVKTKSTLNTESALFGNTVVQSIFQFWSGMFTQYVCFKCVQRKSVHSTRSRITKSYHSYVAGENYIFHNLFEDKAVTQLRLNSNPITWKTFFLRKILST